MGATNTDVAMRAFAAYATGSVDELIPVVHPDADLRPLSPDLSHTEHYTGHEGAREWLAHLAATGSVFRGELEEVLEGEGWVVALGRVTILKPANGFSYSTRVGWVLQIEDGMVKSFRGCRDRHTALRLGGLEPPGG